MHRPAAFADAVRARTGKDGLRATITPSRLYASRNGARFPSPKPLKRNEKKRIRLNKKNVACVLIRTQPTVMTGIFLSLWY